MEPGKQPQNGSRQTILEILNGCKVDMKSDPKRHAKKHKLNPVTNQQSKERLISMLKMVRLMERQKLME